MMSSTTSSRQLLLVSRQLLSCTIMKRTANVNNSTGTTTRTRRILHTTKAGGKKRILHSSAMTPKSAVMTMTSSTTTTATATTAAASSSTTIPSSFQLKTAFVAAAIPMCAFGFMDNLIMIQAGGYIDATFGAAFGLATLSAAALGQVVSDVSGVLFGTTVERLIGRFYAPQSAVTPLTHAQRQLPLVKNVVMAGSVIGIIVGCTLGALSLLFVDLDARDRQEKEQELAVVLCQMMDDATAVLHHDDDLSTTFKSNSSQQVMEAANSQVIVRDTNKWYIPIVQQTKTLGVVECAPRENDDDDSLEMTMKHLAIFMGAATTH